jgi:hypothetical protein
MQISNEAKRDGEGLGILRIYILMIFATRRITSSFRGAQAAFITLPAQCLALDIGYTKFALEIPLDCLLDKRRIGKIVRHRYAIVRPFFVLNRCPSLSFGGIACFK